MLAVFMAKVFVYLKTHQQNYRYLMFQNEASSDRKTHDAQPFYGLSVFGLRLCEVALKVLDLTETARSRSPPSYQRATDGFRPESDQLTYCCDEAEGGCSRWMFGLNLVINVPLLADCWHYKTLMCYCKQAYNLLAHLNLAAAPDVFLKLNIGFHCTLIVFFFVKPQSCPVFKWLPEYCRGVLAGVKA